MEIKNNPLLAGFILARGAAASFWRPAYGSAYHWNTVTGVILFVVGLMMLARPVIVITETEIQKKNLWGMTMKRHALDGVKAELDGVYSGGKKVIFDVVTTNTNNDAVRAYLEKQEAGQRLGQRPCLRRFGFFTGRRGDGTLLISPTPVLIVSHIFRRRKDPTCDSRPIDSPSRSFFSAGSHRFLLSTHCARGQSSSRAPCSGLRGETDELPHDSHLSSLDGSHPLRRWSSTGAGAQLAGRSAQASGGFCPAQLSRRMRTLDGGGSSALLSYRDRIST